MEFVVKETDERTFFRLVLGLVVPRPIAWVSTVSKDGVLNAAPFSFFNAVNDYPPVFMVSIGDRDDGSPKDTIKNILDTGEFVINLVSEESIGQMVKTAEELPPQVSEFETAGISPEESRLIKAPRIKESKASFECKLYKYLKVYDMHLVLGEALLLRVKEGITDPEGRVDFNAYKPVGRLGGKLYVRAHGSSLLEVD